MMKSERSGDVDAMTADSGDDAAVAAVVGVAGVTADVDVGVRRRMALAEDAVGSNCPRNCWYRRWAVVEVVAVQRQSWPSCEHSCVHWTAGHSCYAVDRDPVTVDDGERSQE